MIDEFGFTQEEVSTKVGKSRPFIANTVRLLNLPTVIREHVSRGTMTPGQARPLLVLPTAAMQIEAADEIVSRALTARGAEELVRKIGNKKKSILDRKRPTNNMKNEQTAAIEKLALALGTKVQIVERDGGGGTIMIECYSEEELQRVYEVLTGVGDASRKRDTHGTARLSV